jgi:tRNA-2-methylthio-N6-dimethylallyladenosine synthase
MAEQIPKEVVQERYERLMALVNEVALKENQDQIGTEVEVLVAYEGRKDDATARMSGRSPENRLVHFEVPAGAEIPRPGDMVTVVVTAAAPYHLLADNQTNYSVRRTIAGEAWDRAQADACAVPAAGSTAKASATKSSVSLGLPTMGISKNENNHSH